MPRDARRDPSQPDEQELLPTGEKRRPTLPFGIPAVRPGTRPNESSARAKPAALRPTTRPPVGYAEEVPLRRDTPAAKRLGGFALEPEDERFLEQLAVDLRPHLAWLLGDRRHDFHRELSEGHLDVALDMLLDDRRANPRNVSASKAAHALRDAIRDHVCQRIGPMDAVPFLVREPPVAARSYVRVLPLINGVSTIEDILGSCQLPMLETIRALARLQKVGSIDVPGADLPTPAAKPRARPGDRSAVATPVATPLPTHRGRNDPEDKAPFSSRLTMPEILAPFADDLQAMGVGDASPDDAAYDLPPVLAAESPWAPAPTPAAGMRAVPRRAASTVRPALAASAWEPEHAHVSEAGAAVADPETPIPDGDEPQESPISERSGERPQARIEIDAEPIGARAEEQPEPEADAALDELGAIWRQRATRKSEAAPAPPGPSPGPSPGPIALADDPPAREAPRSLPSIPALDPPPAADSTIDEAAPVSRRSRPQPAANVRFVAIVAALAGLVIVAMIALRFVRSSPPTVAGAPQVVTDAPRTEPAPPPAAPPAAPAAAADTAPAFIDRGTVTFTIKVTPKYARVFLDDVLLVPVSEVKLRREEKDHVLRAEAAGFATRALTVSAKSDASLVIALDRAPGAGPAPAKAPGTTAPKAPTKPPAVAPDAPAPPGQPYPE
jgi:hypothetical protein